MSIGTFLQTCLFVVNWYGAGNTVRVQRRMAGCLVTDELKGTWNEAVMA
jgi:hypothetical protein